jgi:hypothetical protein
VKALRYAFLAVPLLGLAELAAQLWQSRRPPAFDDWYTITGAVREMKQDGDLVVIAPAWADPAARRALGDELMPLRDVARPDVTRYAHALEVSILGERAPEVAPFREVSRREVGRFLLRRLESPAPARVLYDFTDHVRPPFAEAFPTEADRPCTWNPHAQIAAGGLGGHPTFPPERFECPGGVFFNVGVTVIADEEFRPRRCIWSHPFARGELVTRFHKVPLGKVIRGHGGLYWIIERERKGAPVTLTVRVDGDPVGTYVHRDGDGWSPFELPLGAHAGAAEAEVEFAVTSTNYHDRHFCFEADTR